VPAYKAKGFDEKTEVVLGGDFALPSFEVVPRIGVFPRLAVAKGDEEEAKASKPVLFAAVGAGLEEDSPKTLLGSGAGVENADGGGLAETEGVLRPVLVDTNTLRPLTAEKGELVEA